MQSSISKAEHLSEYAEQMVEEAQEQLVAAGTASASNEQNERLDAFIAAFCEKSRNYVQSELQLTLDDYKLLTAMNEVTTQKYANLQQGAESLVDTLKHLHDKQASLKGYFSQINQLEEKVNRLESFAYSMDAYSKRIEAKLKELDKALQPSK